MSINPVGRVKRVLSRSLASVAHALAEPVAPAPDTSHQASFERWVQRRTTKLRPSVPPKWLASMQVSDDPQHVAVVVHVHFPELLDEILTGLQSIPVPFDLIVTNSSGRDVEIDTTGLELARHTIVLDVENRGRDILPLISIVNAGLLDPYEVVLKVHTKKSAWREASTHSGTGEEWRQGFIDGLLGTRSRVERILSEFAENPDVGLITTEGNVLGADHWASDAPLAREILLRMQIDLDEGGLRFAAGSMYWVRGFVLQGLRALNLDADDFEDEDGRVDGTTAHAVERIIGIVTREAGYSLREVPSLQGERTSRWQHYLHDAERVPRARVIPFYLPQFHTFPENDAWWGDGFTEWSNVASAKPVFPGHTQPFLPADLGFYDLSKSGVRQAQYRLAQASGIEGFMYYYYWFAGKKLMSMPVENLVSEPGDEPFCIMWANENWTRRWDGSESDVLIAQDYDLVSARQFIHDVLPLITDPRYIRIDDKPVVAVYRITQIPDYVDVMQYWREVAEKAGLPGLSLLTVDVGKSMQGIEGSVEDAGLDAFLEFVPHNRKWTAHGSPPLALDPRFRGNVLSYSAMATGSELLLRYPVDRARYPGVMVNFDNTARRQWQPDMWYGSNPYTFRRWLNSTVAALADRDFEHRVVFLNAWNEWAEGAVLEPTQHYGKTYLLATRDVLLR
jgi:lipopolysaccharide biosynthesis protein